MAYANPDALVSTDWLVENLGNSDIRIIEVDEDVTLYEKNHIPGAIAWSWSQDLHHPLRRDYLDQDGFSDLLATAGVDPETTVILYGGNNNWFAAYAYWLLKYRGFDNVKLLDGGRKKWELEDLPLNLATTVFPATDLRIEGAERPEIRVFRDDVIDAIGSAKFVDVRSPEEFSGEKLAPDHLPQGAAVRRRTHPGGAQHPLGQGGERGRDLQDGRRATRPLRGTGQRDRDHLLLPDRRAFLAHLVRAHRIAGPHQHQELRRFVDRVRLPGERPGGARRLK